MTIAYKFFEYAEEKEEGYKVPLMRMMELLQVFDENLQLQYDPNNDNEAADRFRATLMVAALSNAFSEDLRDKFGEGEGENYLQFPICDETYKDLLARVGQAE